jgi:hypothetical protein
VCQGALGDCWLLAAIAAAAEKDPEIIRGLFLTREAEPCGCYRLRLFNAFTHRWTIMTIDDRVPVNKDGTPMFSRPHGHELWVGVFGLFTGARSFFTC